MSRRDFRFAGHVLRVEAGEEPLAWLHEFVVPQFAARDTDAPDRTITLIIDAREHARLARHGPHPQHLTRACFTLDSGIVSGRVWDAPDADEVIFDEDREVFYRRWPGEARVVEIIAARDDAGARLALLRVVREYATLYATRAGWLMLHAAAVCIGGDAFVIAGPKRAGKTTLLLHALRNEQGTYVSNDRVALYAEPSGVTVHGIPTIVIIRKESAVWFVDLDAKLAGARYHFRHRVAESNAEHEVASSRPATTWPLSPRQLCRLLGVESRASAPVMAVLFPRVGASPGGMAFEELNAEQALDAWRGTLFRSCPPDGMFAIGQAAAAPSEEGAGLLAARLAARVPSFSCRLGPDAYGDGARWLWSLRQGLASRAALASRTIRA
jgi:hypothetical protein